MNLANKRVRDEHIVYHLRSVKFSNDKKWPKNINKRYADKKYCANIFKMILEMKAETSKDTWPSPSLL